MEPPASPSRASRPTWTRAERIVLVTGTALVAVLVLLPWHHYGIDTGRLNQLGINVPSFSYNRTGVESPGAPLGILAAATSAIVVAEILLARFAPRMVRSAQFHLIGGPVILGLLGAKLLSDHDFLGPGAWLAPLLAAGLTYGGFLVSEDRHRTADG